VRTVPAPVTGKGALRLADQRLENQRITRSGPRTPEKLVAWMGAVQAQEYGPAKWGLGLRSAASITDAVVHRAVDQGRILRTHVLRPTWHFVARDDIRWMLELTAPRVQRILAGYDRRIGLDAAVMTRAAGVVERALGDSGCLTRQELGPHLQRAGLPAGNRDLAHIAMYAELEGLICSGARRGKQPTYALVAERAPAARRLQRDEALAELTKRYFRSHGPATIRDFVWWSGLTSADAKRGLEMIRARQREEDGLRYWTVGRPRSAPRPKSSLHLLPIYDEYLVAYRDLQAVPRPAYLMGNFQHALVSEGQVAGTWRTTATRKGVAVTVETLRPLSAGERRRLEREVTRYSRFIGIPVSLLVS
jgi:Winged helix DNA-binding domain